MALELRQLRYFVAIGNARSLSAAARHLGLSQPSLSQQMQNLETELGVKLLSRNVLGVQLTEAGKILRVRAEEVIALLAQTESEIRKAGARVGG